MTDTGNVHAGLQCNKNKWGRKKYKTYSLERKSTRKLKITAKACAGREAVAVKAISLQREVPLCTIVKGKTSPG